MDEAMEKVGALEGAVDGQESDRWNKAARIEEMLDQVLYVGGSEAADCKCKGRAATLPRTVGITPQHSRLGTTANYKYQCPLPFLLLSL